MHLTDAWCSDHCWIIFAWLFSFFQAQCSRLDYRLWFWKKTNSLNPVRSRTEVYMLPWPTQKIILGRGACDSPDLTCCVIVCVSLCVQVMQVVREQIMRALTLKPNSLDQFKSRLQNLSYTEILKIRQSERMNQEDFQSRPILWVNPASGATRRDVKLMRSS